jgi:hypothetical protein
LTDWDKKKQLFLDAIGDHYVRNENGLCEFESDRGVERNYLNTIIELLRPELDQFGDELGVAEFEILDVWSVRYQKGDWHTPHTHGTSNWSCALYLDIDEESGLPIENLGTHFITDSVNVNTNTSIITSPPITEGVILFFPSNILHFTLPNKSDKPRKIISMDIRTKGRV